MNRFSKRTASKSMNKSMKNQTISECRVWPGLTAAACLAAVWVTGCGKPAHPPAGERADLPAAQVQVQQVESKSRPNTEEVVGTVRAKVRSTVAAKLSGRIQDLPVVLGQKVRAGDLIARLDAAEIKARLEQAEAALEQAERDWKRIAALYEQQATTRAEYDATESRRRMASAAVSEARATLANAEVLAPFDGVITRKWADVGDLAQPGKPLVDLENPNALQIEADVPEAVLARVHAGASLPIRVDALDKELSGTVAEIAPAADPASRSFRVKLDVPPTPGLLPGQFCRLLLPVGEVQSLRAPASAIVRRGQLEIAFVVADQRAVLHLVKTGSRVGNEIEILSGLNSGDAVVVEGADRLVDGQPVVVK
jgi:RND family efflux transporter MFP subunit